MLKHSVVYFSHSAILVSGMASFFISRRRWMCAAVLKTPYYMFASGYLGQIMIISTSLASGEEFLPLGSSRGFRKVLELKKLSYLVIDRPRVQVSQTASDGMTNMIEGV
ncbi:unnamed protein product [Peronospora belbahrii]|uniref:Uncharacterized protein n=1 Tax=Peronospora belbahrii TaxID=622444 RepID=A0AAU9KLM5_9STRA|nr:unnamed protein product [Peronospora belbahrii]CAH0519980.1 unnamed protein product [Peronospora belbahrii]